MRYFDGDFGVNLQSPVSSRWIWRVGIESAGNDLPA
jgi:hypothetical protein